MTAKQTSKEEELIAKSIGVKLQLMRKHRSLSQTQLADRAGVSQTVITQIETGKRLPSLRTIIKLATELGYDLSVSMTDNENFIKKEGERYAETGSRERF